MAANNPDRVDKLQICVILRDWRQSDAERNPNYPQQPIQVIDIPLWTPEEQSAFMLERVKLHQEAAAAIDLEEPLRECTESERWSSGDRFAVYKTDVSKRATRVFDEESEARDFLAKTDGHLVVRPGVAMRCERNYCQVREWCEQWQATK